MDNIRNMVDLDKVLGCLPHLESIDVYFRTNTNSNSSSNTYTRIIQEYLTFEENVYDEDLIM